MKKVVVLKPQKKGNKLVFDVKKRLMITDLINSSTTKDEIIKLNIDRFFIRKSKEVNLTSKKIEFKI